MPRAFMLHAAYGRFARSYQATQRMLEIRFIELSERTTSEIRWIQLFAPTRRDKTASTRRVGPCKSGITVLVNRVKCV